MWLAEGALHAATRWLRREVRPPGTTLSDFGEMRQHLRPADVILVEGRTRIASVIQAVTLSSWTHAALYIGRLDDLPDRELAARLRDTRGFADDEQLTLEAEIGEGVIISRLSRYARDHLRLCRPTGLTAEDARVVIAYTLSRVGTAYDVRQVFDLLRFFFPYGLLPRRWRSSLFEMGSGDIAHTICSTLIAEAYASVDYPILPRVLPGGDGRPVFYRRNPKLMTPRDFDYSPYFEIVKYPFFGDAVDNYRNLRWGGDAPDPIE